MKVLLVFGTRPEASKMCPLENICRAVKRLAEAYGDIEIIFPVHLNLAVRENGYPILDGMAGVKLLEPLDVLDMHDLLAR